MQEIVSMVDINNRTDKDKIENSKWWAGVLYYGSKYVPHPHPHLLLMRIAIRYLSEGINDHGFDINSPELIQQEIDNGNIRPFLWVGKTETKD